ncbi:MAG: Gfo/Idh/MocA family oxidoreductase, partial [Candidatus Nealsonbacteria bacterium]|nr:Gfo/Idh/MocA family oxidoreductase [Candidatus Nealsonbacteria bacterium]
MNLTPEDKAVGKVNFQAAIGSDLTRRKFLQGGIEKNISSKNGLGGYYFGYDGVTDPVRVGVIGTGDEGNVLIAAINPDFLEVKAIADIRPYSRYRAFLGDVYSPLTQKVRCGLNKIYDWESLDEGHRNVKVYEAWQELIANAADDGLEAVIIALPLHLHAPVAIAAMRAGLHVLTEKLMGHSVCECKEMARAATEAGVHLATGHQRHYNILYNNAVEAIKQGLLGELHYIRAQWHRDNMPGGDSWQPPMPESVKPGDAQAKKLEAELTSWKGARQKLIRETMPKLRKKRDEAKTAAATAKAEAAIEKCQEDITLWQAKIEQKEAQISDSDMDMKELVEKHKYQDGDGKLYDRPAIEELIRWRLWNRTGGGLMAELGSHQLDAASIFIAAVHDGVKQHPLSVAAAANRPLFPPDRDVDDHVYCLFEYAAPGYRAGDPIDERRKISVAYASINGNGFGGYGETVFGTEGTLVLEKEVDAMLYRTHETSGKIKVVDEPIAAGVRPKIEVDAAGKGDPDSAAIGGMAVKEAGRGYAEELEHW